MKYNKQEISSEPRYCKAKLNLTRNPEEIPTLIPTQRLNVITEGDPNPYMITEEIEDIKKPANGIYYSVEFWNSYLEKMKKRPIPGSKDGHTMYSGKTPNNDIYTIGGELKENKVFLKVYIPPEGAISSNKSFIRDVKAGLVHFSIVTWTKDNIERDENGWVKKITAIESVKGERNDAVEYGMGAMQMKVNKENIIEVLNQEEFDFEIEFSGFIPLKYNPYPNEHAARIRQPGDFEKDSFKRINIKTGIDAIIGKLKGKKTTTTQAYRFDAKKFTAAQAKKWLKDHNIKYISFEPASGKSDKQEVNYIMPGEQYKEIIENLKNQLDNGAVSKANLAKDLSIEIVTDEHKNAIQFVADITKIAGENPIKRINELIENESKVAKQKYDNERETLMSKEFGPMTTKQNGKDIDNLKRQAAEPLVSKEIQSTESLTAQIAAAKENSVVKNISFQVADITSDINDVTGVRIVDQKDTKRTSEFVSI